MPEILLPFCELVWVCGWVKADLPLPLAAEAEQEGRLQSAEELGGLLPRRYRRRGEMRMQIVS